MTPDTPRPSSRSIQEPTLDPYSPSAASLSAVVLTRNGAGMLARLFESLAAHNTQRLVEIIVIDHGSTDATSEVVQEWAGALPLVHVRFRTNHGYSWSTNRAAERARGDYLVFLNNDIVLIEDILPPMLATAQAAGGIVGIRQLRADRDGVPVGHIHHVGVGFRWHPARRFWNPFNLEPGPLEADHARETVEMAVLTGAVMMVERRLYLELGGHDESYFYGFEDVDFCLKASLGRGLPVICMNGLAALHTEGGTRGTAALRVRRNRARANSRPFISRWEYPVWRHIRRRGFGGDDALLGTRAPIALAGPRGPLLDAVERSLERPVLAVEDVDSPAIVCVTDPLSAPFARAQRQPSIAVIGLVGDNSAAWRQHPELPAYDLLVAGNRATVGELRAAGAAAACRPEEIREALAERAESPRAGLSCLWPGPDITKARGMLAHAGIASRVHPMTRHQARFFIDDDVIVRASPLPLPPGRPHRPAVSLAPAGTLIERILDADRNARRPPIDAPLPNLSGADFPEDA